MARGTTAPGKRRAAARESDVLDVTVVLLDAGYASTAIGPMEVFHSAGYLWNWLHGETGQPRFRVRAASVDGKAVASPYSLRLLPECAIGDIGHTDIVIIPSCPWDVQDYVMRKTALLGWLRERHARGAFVAGICTGVALLAASGLLDGRRATTHWAVAEMLRQRYPKVDWQPEQFITEDGRIFCSGGVYSALDLSLYLVERICGHEIALQCARSLLISMPRSRQSGYAVLPLSRPHGDDKIRRVEEHLQQHFDRGISMQELATGIGMSPRNFIRRFKAATGHLPGDYLQKLRISAARELLERGGMPVQIVSAKIGYDDPAFFRSLFKRHTGMTPAEYREQFGAMSFDRGELEAETRAG